MSVITLDIRTGLTRLGSLSDRFNVDFNYDVPLSIVAIYVQISRCARLRNDQIVDGPKLNLAQSPYLIHLFLKKIYV